MNQAALCKQVHVLASGTGHCPLDPGEDYPCPTCGQVTIWRIERQNW